MDCSCFSTKVFRQAKTESPPSGVPPDLQSHPLLVKLIEKSESPIDSFSLVIKKNILYFA